jgi:hypothetical protein
MWTTLAFVAALGLAPQQAGKMNLTNVRVTNAPLGVLKADNKVLPGDSLYIVFDIEGITVAPDGRVLYSMTTEFLDKNGKVLFKQEPRELETINALGGNTVPAYVHIECGLDQPPGEYTVRVTVTDRASKQSQVLERKFQVLDKGFGIVRLMASTDPEGRLPASIFEVGGGLSVGASVVGFERDKATGQPNVNVELQILDDKGKPTLAKPFVGAINEKVPANLRSLPAHFFVPLNRPGKFTVQLKATDQIGKKTATLSFPLNVLSTK